MAGVIAHSRAIVNSANARTLVTFIKCTAFSNYYEQVLPKTDVSPSWAKTAVTGITALPDRIHPVCVIKETQDQASRKFAMLHLRQCVLR